MQCFHYNVIEPFL